MELDEVYQRFDEEHRLNGTQWARVEFLTTTHYIDSCLHPKARILDIGAGTGAYSLHYAGQGYAVTAVEPVEHNLDILMRHVRPCMDLKPILGNALDLSQLRDDSFDLVRAWARFIIWRPMSSAANASARRSECVSRAGESFSPIYPTIWPLLPRHFSIRKTRCGGSITMRISI